MAHAVASRAPANKWVIASTVVLASFVVLMDVSIVNVAMLQMLGEFGVPLETIPRVAVAYGIAEIIMVTLAAWCSVFLGRKSFYLLSFSIFTAASMLCGVARLLEMIIVARLLQGFGGGGLIPVAQATMLKTFPAEERSMAMAIYNGVFWMMGMLFVVGLPFLMLLRGRTLHPTLAPVSRQPAS